ncbi:TrbC/VirB2 family protein [Rickettsiales bacterium]|nr:TrbC/VirB2 family protein [Rickettsiales bacterium]
MKSSSGVRLSSKLRLFLKIGLLSIFSFFVSSTSADAVVRLSTCQLKPATGATGADQSNCDTGLVCDRAALVCVYTYEQGCTLSVKCSVGTSCLTDADKQVTGTQGGTCKASASTSVENNALSDVLCNVYAFVTGKTGRIVIGIIFVGAGGTFILGKMQMGTVVAIALGCGCIFGASAIVSVLVGRGFAC